MKGLFTHRTIQLSMNILPCERLEPFHRSRNLLPFLPKGRRTYLILLFCQSLPKTFFSQSFAEFYCFLQVLTLRPALEAPFRGQKTSAPNLHCHHSATELTSFNCDQLIDRSPARQKLFITIYSQPKPSPQNTMTSAVSKLSKEQPP